MGGCLGSESSSKKKYKQQQQQQKPVTQVNQSQISEQDKVILKLKAHRDKIRDQKRSLEQNANKAQEEAKVYIQKKQKERALFCLKRKKLYENILQDVENKYVIIEKTIIDVESKVQMVQFTQVLKESNDLIKELEKAIELDKLQEIAQDIKERERSTREFNQLFEAHHVNDQEIDDLFAQFEAEVNGTEGIQQKSVVMNKSTASTMKNTQRMSNSIAQSQMKKSTQHEKEEEEDEIQNKLAALA
jgi:Small-conductance mechanosensitive channel